MTYYRRKATSTRCDHCGRPFREHRYVTTDRDGPLHECPDATDVAVKGMSIEGRIRAKCFCGQWVTVGYKNPGNEPVILHPQPACQRFLKDEPLDQFLSELRRHWSMT